MRPLLDDLAVLEDDDQVGVRIVESRCAMMNAVLPARSVRRASSIRRSVPMSTLEVASSRTRMRGSARSARAKATSWRWPSESRVPRSATSVS